MISGLGSARVSRAGERVLAIAHFPSPQDRGRIPQKACFGVTPKPTRETRALPRLYANTLSVITPLGSLIGRAQTNLVQHPAHCNRRRRSFGVTLVFWNENAWEKCSESGDALA